MYQTTLIENITILKKSCLLSSTPIRGVKFIKLADHQTSDGSFCEISRLTANRLNPVPHFIVKQISFSKTLAGSIKAWHYHDHQDDVWYISNGQKLAIGTLDLRQNSTTLYRMNITFLNGKSSHLIYIPSGVAHGYATSKTPGFIIYFTNQHYNSRSPDEHELPWDFLGKGLWQTPKR